MSRQVARVETAEQRAEQLLATLESMHVRLAILFQPSRSQYLLALVLASEEEHLLQRERESMHVRLTTLL